MTEIEYLENTIKQIVKELKLKNCLSQDFEFLTKAERELLFEQHIDQFLKSL